MADPKTWLLPFTSADPNASDGDGRPWGDGTAMAARAAARAVPWDAGCRVTPIVGGFATLNAIRDTFEAAITAAEQMERNRIPPGRRGRVYIADWLMNALRDLSVGNAWGTLPWKPGMVAEYDQTALGLVLRMMSAGIVVRILLWEPTTAQAVKLEQHSLEHWSIAAAVQDHDRALQALTKIDTPYGMVALDLRTASPMTASLHQKVIVVRVGAVNVAYCGGVDLAFTRRDATPSPLWAVAGDWQSGNRIPDPQLGWPHQTSLRGGYPAFPSQRNLKPFPEDLPADVYGPWLLHWFDQHLKLEGPVVSTLEDQFRERWIDQARTFVFDRTSSIGNDNQVQFTDKIAIRSDGTIAPLPNPDPAPAAGNAVVQMWRTIPLRKTRNRSPFVRGEFTVLSGVAHAASQATELIAIWDQYFWSVPLARLLAWRIRTVKTLNLLIVLPPFGSADTRNELNWRKTALGALWADLGDAANRGRVTVLDMWLRTGGSEGNRGIYNHSKTQTYDDALLVCGSANMNRRSFECDAELDCAVLDETATRAHVAALYRVAAGETATWTDFAPGWGGRYRDACANAVDRGTSQRLIRDPFFPAVRDPKTPNGVPIPTDGQWPQWVIDPSSIAGTLDDKVCNVRGIGGDPGVKGRLDAIAFLLERCHKGADWPFRKPY